MAGTPKVETPMAETPMAEEQQTEPASSPSPTTLRWRILRKALLRRHRGVADELSASRVSRKSTRGFDLIPCKKSGSSEEGNPHFNLENQKDVCFRYALPVDGCPELLLCQRTGGAVLNDFDICNQYDIDNTGLVCPWPSEEVLAYYCLSNVAMFRSKRVLELGAGYGLAGLSVAIATMASEVVISDGNPQVVDYIQRSIIANSSAFGETKVNALLLHWNQAEEDLKSFSNTFDIIVASDCTFFKDFHQGLVKTVKLLLKDTGLAIFFSPRRGDSLDKFLEEVKSNGLDVSVTENYDACVWKRHSEVMRGDNSWPNYEKDHCYPLLVRVTR